MSFLTRNRTTRLAAQGHAVLSSAGPRRQAVAAAFAIVLHGTALAAAPAAPESTQEIADSMTAKEVGEVSCQYPETLYPAHAKLMGQQGTTILHVTIGTSGQVEQAEVRMSSGNTDLDTAAVATIMQAHCKPHFENGRPIRFSTQLPIPFYLERGSIKTI